MLGRQLMTRESSSTTSDDVTNESEEQVGVYTHTVTETLACELFSEFTLSAVSFPGQPG